METHRIGRLQGRYVVTWQDGETRRRIRLKAETKREAEIEAIRVLEEAHRVEPKPKAQGQRVRDIWASYTNYLGDRSAATAMHYAQKIILPHFGDLMFDEVTVDLCRAHTARRVAGGIGLGTVWTELTLLRSALSWAAKMHQIPFAPYVQLPQKPAPKARWLTREEVAKLLDADGERHIMLAIRLMLTTAARVSAVLDLTWDRVDLKRRQIDLRLDAEGPRKGRAVVPINDSLMGALKVARSDAQCDHVIEWHSKPVAQIRNGFVKACKLAGLDGVSPHVLRHTAAVHMAVANVPMARISQYLGHSNTAVTERVYARFAPDHLRDVSAVLEW